MKARIELLEVLAEAEDDAKNGRVAHHRVIFYLSNRLSIIKEFLGSILCLQRIELFYIFSCGSTYGEVHFRKITVPFGLVTCNFKIMLILYYINYLVMIIINFGRG